MTDAIDRLKRIRDQQFYMVSKNGEGHLKFKYGLTRRDVCAILIKQNGYCDCCGVDLENTKWCIDHNHKTGAVRGLLCYGCNTGIGKLGGTLEGVQKADAYLRKHGETV
jgi:hypothetical protein